MTRTKIGVALSGGVDSTMTALYLKEMYDVHGFFMILAQPDLDQQKDRVAAIAERLQISLEMIDLQQHFSETVLEYFSSSYFSGKTPNPCMICNPRIKFGLFLDAVLARDMVLLATGHYARIVQKDSCYHLLRGCDEKKDQSYFLAGLSQYQLSHLLFPLGEKRKTEIMQSAADLGFANLFAKESQDVCFLGNEEVGKYLSRHYPNLTVTGPILSTEGQYLGEHTGIFQYTIGQRRGLGLPDLSPWYVADVDAQSNTIIVGKPESLYHDILDITHLHWLQGAPPDLNQTYTVAIRSGHRGSEARLQILSPTEARITFTMPQRAVTPGQFAVIRKDDEILGSGIIDKRANSQQ